MGEVEAVSVYTGRMDRGETLLLLGMLVIACSSPTVPGSACPSAGGKCFLGGTTCAKPAALSAQDCETTPPNAGGAFCCLDGVDVGITPSDGGRDSRAKDTSVNDAADARTNDARDAALGRRSYSCLDASAAYTSVTCSPGDGGMQCTGLMYAYPGCPAFPYDQCYCGAYPSQAGANPNGWVCVGHSCQVGTGSGSSSDAGGSKTDSTLPGSGS